MHFCKKALVLWSVSIRMLWSTILTKTRCIIINIEVIIALLKMLARYINHLTTLEEWHIWHLAG